MKFLNLIIAAGLLYVTACASATTTVLEPSERSIKSASMAIVHGEDTVAVEDEYRAYFQTKLGEELYTEGAFINGEEMTLRYRFIQLDQGSRTKRYVLGPIAGKGTMTIEIIYLDSAGVEVAKIHTGGEVSGGFFGGSFKSALDKAAAEAATYAISNFR